MIQLVTCGSLAALLGGLIFAMARPVPAQPVGTPPSLPRHALRPHGGGVPASDLLRRHQWTRPLRTRRARSDNTEASAETQRLIERTLDRLHRLGPTPTYGSDPEATTPLPVLREG
ncbi:hypothetical protein LX15_000007 [Streptoalloteichus tenebrarius]|uniref:Secreted protein n=2 Tax=Streptoalloteichus tenebrarius (strain ATCC 17920 / DSM 40477 / JCM 4838 / CBS 697.72 / NBRC 16177 / NCIMB 11028 / NRRL B-12390 / A12253. 1 / ISP 5477) TaxID=1933 RepID=A0ABT1HLC7_STRSD|nr:hypothetical protein [Streptoalloteichus tenebrarius]MCP2256324.1 hypothetical protein [Streptoalloteichus tenebrarius]BFF04663.1 hypothetical protein GCM10020241_63380 [Streptoalloteichus tenebrarius]